MIQKKNLFLSYYDGYLKIPNKELMLEFEKALEDESFGYVSKIIENSKSMLKATVNKDVKIIEEILHDIHNSEIPMSYRGNRLDLIKYKKIW